MSRSELGRLIVATGAVLVFVRVLVWAGALAWFRDNRLPAGAASAAGVAVGTKGCYRCPSFEDA